MLTRILTICMVVGMWMGTAIAAPQEQKEIDVEQGSHVVLDLPSKPKRIAVGNDDVAHVTPVENSGTPVKQPRHAGRAGKNREKRVSPSAAK
jgi:Flp pilus assembly secretin CpaC